MRRLLEFLCEKGTIPAGRYVIDTQRERIPQCRIDARMRRRRGAANPPARAWRGKAFYVCIDGAVNRTCKTTKWRPSILLLLPVRDLGKELSVRHHSTIEVQP